MHPYNITGQEPILVYGRKKVFERNLKTENKQMYNLTGDWILKRDRIIFWLKVP